MSTMLGAIDAPMSDYASDYDITMQPHSSDPWSQEDGVMEEVQDSTYPIATTKSTTMDFSSTIPDTQLAFSTSQGTDIEIEVEMEDYVEGHNAEYEMLDESEAIVEDTAEVQDVEVVDAGPSPEVALALPVESYPPSHAPEASIVSAPSIDSVVPDTPQQEQTLDVPVSVAEPAAIVEEVPATDVSPAAAPTVHPEPEVIESHDSHPQPEPTTSISEGVPEQHAENAMHEGEQMTEHQQEQTVEGQSATEPAVPQASGEVDVNAVPVDNEQPREEYAPQHVEGTEEVSNTEVQPAQPQPELRADEPEEEYTGEEALTGFYSDPPAVVLRLDFLQHSVPLFNRPTDEDHGIPSDSSVMFQDRPMLFYEPLPTFFTALRETDVFQQHCDVLGQAELGIFVDSLQLSVSEDNAYAQDVSLHDLSLLHDSFHTGLLQLQLHMNTPRFAVRYQELQDQLQRLVHEDDPYAISESDPTVQETNDQNVERAEVPQPEEKQELDYHREPEAQQFLQGTGDLAEQEPKSTHNAGTDATGQVDATHQDQQDFSAHEWPEGAQLEEIEEDENNVGHGDTGNGPEVQTEQVRTDEIQLSGDGDDRVESTVVPEAEPAVESAERDGSPTLGEDEEALVYVDPDPVEQPNDEGSEGHDAPTEGEENVLEGHDDANFGEGEEGYDYYEADPEVGEVYYEEEDENLYEEDADGSSYSEEHSLEDGVSVAQESEEQTQEGQAEVTHEDASHPVEHEAPSLEELPPLPDEDDDELDRELLEGEDGASTNEQLGEEPAAPTNENHESFAFDATEDPANTTEGQEDIENTEGDADVGDWDGDLDGEGEADSPLDGDNENILESDGSSVTLSSARSKRSYHDIDADEDDLEGNLTPSPQDAKRTRLH
ncbi:hypothetical protein CC1G_05153 [Coprinopsis cinerea okayama7|uniref:Uncharacterized protein n=1 Tax=Coprinopsis cinerea (strain Okayama-7 / 130 / ATCC MYA-4618 / FGSC 9003) TaxID=240176 RepID=A8NG19_COPC7|nr:hypothetical protein CC1G_05153 [Coprinopsis cinerea okayama7\|eukprot:XP_001833453.2 hypothetical protein CC1G_05153 [Coprinopsis cinerea okayama7\